MIAVTFKRLTGLSTFVVYVILPQKFKKINPQISYCKKLNTAVFKNV